MLLSSSVQFAMSNTGGGYIESLHGLSNAISFERAVRWLAQRQNGCYTASKVWTYMCKKAAILD